MDLQTYTVSRKPRKRVLKNTFFVMISICVLGLFIGYIAIRANSTPPDNFPVDTDVVIGEGLTQSEIVQELVDASVVKSSLLLHIALIHYYEGDYILAGTYHFPKPLTTREVAEALTIGLYRTPMLKLVLPEGFSVHDFHDLLPDGYATTDRPDLSANEGYLFPDTYFITSDMSINEITLMLRDTMKEKLVPYAEAINGSGFTEAEVLILASIIEREANDKESMGYVSGILQNRLDEGMALQVDATLDYILNKTSAELTLEDLELDSPFNTYEYRGLPPHPIANPGLTSIEAVLYPTKSDYMFYLTGNDGEFYYAKSFEEHKQNKARYLR